MKKSKPEPKALVYTFSDGTKHTVTVEELKRLDSVQSARMAASDSGYLASLGDVRLREAGLGPMADMAATNRKRRLQPRKAALAPREDSRDSTRKRVIDMMKREKDGGVEFKVLMSRWEKEPIDDLILTARGEKEFTVTDDLDGSEKLYKWGTLSKLFSTRPLP